MSANFYGSPFDSRRRPHKPTTDLDNTTDVHEENTVDLEPGTVDVPRSPLASLSQQRQPARPTAPVIKQEPRREVSVPVAKPERSFNRAARPPVVPREPSARDAGAMDTTNDAKVVREDAVRHDPIVALRDEPPIITPEQIVAREYDVPVPSAFGKREPFVSTPAAAVTESSSTTADVRNDARQASLANSAPVRKSIAAKSSESAAPRPALAPGKILCDRYLLEQVIGCGGTAVVFRARDMLSGKGTAKNVQVAIKSPRPELGDASRAAMRLKHEFEHAKLLSHPSIVRVLELHEDDGQRFMTMELVEGKLLSQMLRDWTMLPVALAHKILRLCAEALNYAHSHNVVHGDFKPGNVFITPDEGVRIVDFGTAAGPLTNDSRIPAGTPTYASPEVLSGDTPDTRDDVFSFACVAYEMLTGQHPFGRQSSLQAREEGKIPPRAWNLSTTQWLSLLSALSWKREQRPTNVEELLTRLNPEEPLAALPVPVHVDPEEVVPAELPADLMPKQRSWGFFAFIAIALLVSYMAYQRQNAPGAAAEPKPAIVPAAAALPPDPRPLAPTPEPTVTPAPAAAAAPETTVPVQAAPAVVAKPRAAAPISDISFEAPSIVTSESSVAAVFLIKRSQPLSGRVTVTWKAISGTADAGIDFTDASGAVTFADGQAQRAIYVPLRNDLLKEGDESFFIQLSNPKSARLGKLARAEAIIRDDE